MRSKKEFKICIIGCGSHSASSHGPALVRYAREYKDTTLVACCDINSTKAESYMKYFGFQKFYTDIDEMLDTERPDAVSIILPESIEAKFAIKVLKKGYPLILEKPPGKSLEEAYKLIKAAEENNVPNQVAFNRRYHPIVRKMKSILDISYSPSQIHNIRYEMYRYNRKENTFWTTAIHGVDVVRNVANSDYKHIDFFYQDFPQLGGTASNIYMHCTFESGSTAQLCFCPLGGINTEQMTINVLDNTFILDMGYYTKGTLKQYTNNTTVVLDIKGEDLFTSDRVYDYSGYYHENEDFFNDIRDGRKPKGDIKSSIQSMEVTCCIADRKASYDKL